MKILYRPARPKAYRNPGYIPERMKEGKTMSRQVRRQLQRRALKMPPSVNRWKTGKRS